MNRKGTNQKDRYSGCRRSIQSYTLTCFRLLQSLPLISLSSRERGSYFRRLHNLTGEGSGAVEGGTERTQKKSKIKKKKKINYDICTLY